jgi:hypothetical protein
MVSEGARPVGRRRQAGEDIRMNNDCVEMEECGMCHGMFVPGTLDFLGRCEPCFRDYINAPRPDETRLFQGTGNPHNPKETRAYVQRLERKRVTDQGVDHNYVKRIYG